MTTDAEAAALGDGMSESAQDKGEAVSDRLDHGHTLPNNGPAIMPPVHIVEYPDQEGRRWQRALEILLEAGRAARRAESAA